MRILPGSTTIRASMGELRGDAEFSFAFLLEHPAREVPCGGLLACGVELIFYNFMTPRDTLRATFYDSGKDRL